jgi:hypothetical protein
MDLDSMFMCVCVCICHIFDIAGFCSLTFDQVSVHTTAIAHKYYIYN